MLDQLIEDIITGNDRHAADIAEDFLRELGWEL